MSKVFDREAILYLLEDDDRNDLINILLESKDTNSSTNITDKEHHALKLLDHCTRENRGGSLTSSELKFLQEFLIDNMGNMNLVQKFKNAKDLDMPVDENVTEFICSFIYATQDTEGFISASDRLDQLLQNTEQAEKLTIEEAGLIDRAARVSKKLDEIKSKYQPLFSGGYLGVFADKVQRASKNLEIIEADILNELKLETGDIIFVDDKKYSSLSGKKFNAEQKFIKQNITKYGHVSKILVKEGVIKQSHLTSDSYRDGEEFYLRQHLYSHSLKIDVSKMVPESKQKELDVKDPNWRTEIKKRYQSIQDKISQTEDQERRYDGMNASIPLGKRIRIGMSKIFSVNEKKKERENFSKIKDKMFGGEYSSAARKKRGKKDKTMMCSAFIAREMVASLVELDEWVESKYQVKNAVEIPFNKDVKFSQLLPGRLYDILLEKGICSEVEKTPTEKRIFVGENAVISRSKNQNVQAKLSSIVEEELDIYRRDFSKNAKDSLRDNLIRKIAEVVVKNKDHQAIGIKEEDLKFVENHVEKLVSNADKQNSKSSIKIWVENIMDYIGIKSDYRKVIEAESSKIRAIISNNYVSQDNIAINALSVVKGNVSRKR